MNRTTVFDQEFNVLPGAMETLSHENGVQIAKVAWLSRKVNPKTYGPMVVYLTKNNDAKRLLQTFSSQVNRHIRVYSSRSLDRNNVVTAKGSVTKHSCAARIDETTSTKLNVLNHRNINCDWQRFCFIVSVLRDTVFLTLFELVTYADWPVSLDSLVIGSSDPRRKTFLKGSQSRTWTTFIEAVTADGRLLKPGIIFKGKELQQQWFIDGFNKIADWYYITSGNCWTDNHIAVEWLKEVYLPQPQPADESDARLIILDGRGSHVSDEWMAMCFLNNVYCCYLPAHCSHGLQPLDNGAFNASKAAYRKELQNLTSLTDSAPVDKVNFIKAYARARGVGMTKKNILSGWRVTGNWPISRRKALMHPEIQPDKKKTTPGSHGHRDGQVDSDHTPTTSRHIRDLAKNKSPSTRRRYSVISRGFEAQELKIASLSTRIASLEEEVSRLSRGKKRKAIPGPNKRLMTLAESLVTGETISKVNEAIEEADAVEDVIEMGGMEEDERSNSGMEELGVVRTRAGREVKKPRKY
ncbi:transposase [Fusarium oxysporum f. sp. phaseoli]